MCPTKHSLDCQVWWIGRDLLWYCAGEKYWDQWIHSGVLCACRSSCVGLDTSQVTGSFVSSTQKWLSCKKNKPCMYFSLLILQPLVTLGLFREEGQQHNNIPCFVYPPHNDSMFTYLKLSSSPKFSFCLILVRSEVIILHMELKLLLSSICYFAGLNFICQFLAQLLSYFMSLCSSRSGLFLNNALAGAACFPAWPVFHLEFYHIYDGFGFFKMVLQTFLQIIYQKWQMSTQQAMWLLFCFRTRRGNVINFCDISWIPSGELWHPCHSHTRYSRENRKF